jgi:hypothetical protein
MQTKKGQSLFGLIHAAYFRLYVYIVRQRPVNYLDLNLDHICMYKYSYSLCLYMHPNLDHICTRKYAELFGLYMRLNLV